MMNITVVLLAALAATTDPIAALAEREAGLALKHQATPRGAAPLFRLHALRDELPDLALLSRTYQAVLAAPRTDPHVRVLARTLAAQTERGRGSLNKAAELERPLGYVHDFYVLGGFDNEGKSHCDTDFGPEKALDLKAIYPLRDQRLAWRKLQQQPPDGFIDLASALRPNREAIAYALTFLEAQSEQTVNVSLGTSGAFRLWVNGELAHSSDDYHLARPDQARAAVRLKRGSNRVLLKVCQETSPLGFYLRLERAGPGLKVVLPDELPVALKATKPVTTVQPTLASALAAQVARAPKDAALRADYATVLWHTRAYDERQQTAASEMLRAAENAPGDPHLLLLAAQLQDDDGNERRRLLERALSEDAGFVHAQLLLAQHELSMNHPERALTLLEKLTREHPKLGPSRLLLARAHEALNEPVTAANLVEDAFRELRTPSVVRQAAFLSRRQSRPQEALERFRVALGLRTDDLDARRQVASILADLGRLDEAADELNRILKLDPFDNATRLRAAELHAANGRIPQAEALFAEAKALSPDDHDVHQREGRILLQTGRREQGLAALEKSLSLTPQNPTLKEALRTLKGEQTTLGSQYLLDATALAKGPEGKRFASEDAVYVVDSTYVRVQPTGLSSRFHQLAMRVRTARGVEAFRSYPISYSPGRQEVQIIRARVTKPDGAVVETFVDTERNLNEPWSGMYYDTRARVLSFPSLAPGDLLELQYRLDDTTQDNLLSDYWGDVDYVQTVLPKLRYQFIVDMPAGRPLYWSQARVGTAATHEQREQKDGRVVHAWTAANVPKILPEPSMPGWAEVVPTIHVSTYKTWDDVGRYYWGLVKDQLLPNEELRKTVAQTLKGVNAKDTLAVVRALYGFVVTNTRYVALEFGIHGFKPYRVDRVLARRFGDCKDKASLLYAMLKVAGVDSRLVLLRMRHLGDIGPEPASLAAFNHAILYVPKLDLYLDGTAEFHGAAELPYADRLANVLRVEPTGDSPFLTTPEGRAEDNRIEEALLIRVDAKGQATTRGTRTAHGVEAPNHRRTFQTAGTRNATLENSFSHVYPGVQAKVLAITDVAALEQPSKLEYELAIPRFAEVLGNGLRVYPFASPRSFTQLYATLGERKLDLVLTHPWTQKLHVELSLPDGHTAQALPENFREQTPFGHAWLEYRQVDGKLVCDAEVALTTTRIKASDYPAFRAFLMRVDQAFGRKVFVEAPSSQTAVR